MERKESEMLMTMILTVFGFVSNSLGMQIPTNLTVHLNPASNTISWAGAISGDFKYKVMRKKSPSKVFIVRKILSSSIQSYEDESILGRTTYTYKIRTYKIGQPYVDSSEVTVTTGDLPTIKMPLAKRNPVFMGPHFYGTYSAKSTAEDVQNIYNLGIRVVMEYYNSPDVIGIIESLKLRNMKVFYPFYMQTIADQQDKKNKHITFAEMEAFFQNQVNYINAHKDSIIGLYLMDEPEYSGFTSQQEQWAVDLAKKYFPTLKTFIAYSHEKDADDRPTPVGLTYRGAEYYSDKYLNISKVASSLDSLKSNLNGAKFIVIPNFIDRGSDWDDEKVAKLNSQILDLISDRRDVAGVLGFQWQGGKFGKGLNRLPKTQTAIQTFIKSQTTKEKIPEKTVCAGEMKIFRGPRLYFETPKEVVMTDSEVGTHKGKCIQYSIDQVNSTCKRLPPNSQYWINFDLRADNTDESQSKIFNLNSQLDFPTESGYVHCP